MLVGSVTMQRRLVGGFFSGDDPYRERDSAQLSSADTHASPQLSTLARPKSERHTDRYGTVYLRVKGVGQLNCPYLAKGQFLIQ